MLHKINGYSSSFLVTQYSNSLTILIYFNLNFLYLSKNKEQHTAIIFIRCRHMRQIWNVGRLELEVNVPSWLGLNSFGGAILSLESWNVQRISLAC